MVGFMRRASQAACRPTDLDPRLHFLPDERDLIAAQPDVAQHVVAEPVELAARFAHELCPSVRLDKRADPVAHQGDLSSRTSAPAPSPAYVSAPTSNSPSPRTR